jgi:hypothetical protein
MTCRLLRPTPLILLPSRPHLRPVRCACVCGVHERACMWALARACVTDLCVCVRAAHRPQTSHHAQRSAESAQSRGPS